jgi:hypothetical protein
VPAGKKENGPNFGLGLILLTTTSPTLLIKANIEGITAEKNGTLCPPTTKAAALENLEVEILTLKAV